MSIQSRIIPLRDREFQGYQLPSGDRLIAVDGIAEAVGMTREQALTRLAIIQQESPEMPLVFAFGEPLQPVVPIQVATLFWMAVATDEMTAIDAGLPCDAIASRLLATMGAEAMGCRVECTIA